MSGDVELMSSTLENGLRITDTVFSDHDPAHKTALMVALLAKI